MVFVYAVSVLMSEVYGVYNARTLMFIRTSYH